MLGINCVNSERVGSRFEEQVTCSHPLANPGRNADSSRHRDPAGGKPGGKPRGHLGHLHRWRCATTGCSPLRGPRSGRTGHLLRFCHPSTSRSRCNSGAGFIDLSCPGGRPEGKGGDPVEGCRRAGRLSWRSTPSPPIVATVPLGKSFGTLLSPTRFPAKSENAPTIYSPPFFAPNLVFFPSLVCK